MKNKLVVTLSLIGFFIMSNCTSHKSNGQELAKKWILVEMEGFEKERLSKISAYIDLAKSSDGENQDIYSSFMGCNRMSFGMKILQEDKISITGLQSTLMYCDGNMDIEEKFQKEFVTMSNYKIEKNKLILSNGKGDKMIFSVEKPSSK